MYSPLCSSIVPSPNYSVTNKRTITYLVIHTTEGGGTGSVAWLSNPESGVSAHYVVMEDGEIVGMVSENDAAWHAGIISGTPTTPLYDGVNPNSRSIGIEIAGYWDVPIAPQQHVAVVALIRDIHSRWGTLPLVAHSELSPGNRRDPGQYNLDWIKGSIEEVYDEEQVKATIRAVLTSPEGANLVEYAFSRPEGFATKLRDALGRRVAQAVQDAIDEALVS